MLDADIIADCPDCTPATESSARSTMQLLVLGEDVDGELCDDHEKQLRDSLE